MNKSESKYFNTAILMDKALIEILENKDFEYITIKEICKKAGVNRSTFYLHYETIGDLLSECLEYIERHFNQSFPSSQDRFISEIDEAPLDKLILINSDYLRPYLNFCKEHRSVYKAAHKNPVCMNTEKAFHNISEYVIMPIMNRFNVPPDVQKYWISFFIHGCTAIILEWINNDCKESVEEMEQIIIDCIRPTFKSRKDI